MKTMIIGSLGQLGTDCMGQFADADVLGLDYKEVDITRRDKLFAVLNDLKPDVIVNCAAYTAVDKCESEEELARKVNADGPAYLAEWTEANQSYLVHISTDYVFDGRLPLYQSYVESHAVHPVSAYGRTKAEGEQRIMAATDRCAILRTAWLCSTHGNNFLKTVFRITQSGKPMRIINEQFGSFTWSHTLARQIRAIADARVQGLFHATSEGYCSWYELAVAYMEHTKCPYDISPCTAAEYPTPATRPVNSILENAHLKSLDMNLFVAWQDELKAFCSHLS
ncbi:MAG: dTDP-4-dehydrorhamnose reductase [Spartobacteria bacterium]|nr:dTDP-4-dehydrorhamnose reductase [Spartobacteria bacterium]